MKKLITAIIIAAASANVSAEQSTCEGIEKMAEAVMWHRQNETGLRELIGMLDGESELAVTIIKDAYKRPRFHGDEYQQSAIRDFADRWYMTCIDELGVTF